MLAEYWRLFVTESHQKRHLNKQPVGQPSPRQQTNKSFKREPRKKMVLKWTHQHIVSASVLLPSSSSNKNNENEMKIVLVEMMWLGGEFRVYFPSFFFALSPLFGVVILFVCYELNEIKFEKFSTRHRWMERALGRDEVLETQPSHTHTHTLI